MEYRCSVKLYKADGEALVEAAGCQYRMSMADFLKSGVADGECCGEGALLFFEEAAEKLRCIKKAFVFLAYGPQAERRLMQKLRKAGFGADAVAKTLTLLEKKGYLDDMELCAEQAFALRKYKMFGKARIKKELYAKGFGRDCIEEALSALKAGDGEEGGVPGEAACVKKLLSEKFPSLSPDDREGRAKAFSYLHRMGYSYNDINNAVSVLGRD